jgi:hypothetical protein
MFLHAPTVIRIRRLLYAIILGRKYSIRSGTNNYFYHSCQFRFEYSVFCSSNLSIDEGMFGFSIGASKIDLGEFTESNGHVCDDAISVLGGSGLVVVKDEERDNPSDVQDNNVLT